MRAFLFLMVAVFSITAKAENYSMCSAPVVISATATSAQVLAANSKRTYLIIVNKSTTVTAQLKYGSAQSGTEGLPVVPGGNYESYEPGTQAIFAVTSSSTAPLTIVQCNGN